MELRGPLRLVENVPNNNGIDEIINGPRGQVAPFTRPSIESPKWDWEPKMTMMRHVWTNRELQPTNRSTDFLWPMGIRPLELRGPQTLEVQVVPNNNGIDEILNGPRGEMAPVSRPPNTSPKYDWEPSLTMMRHVWTMEEDSHPSSAPAVVHSGNGARIFRIISVLALAGLWFLA